MCMSFDFLFLSFLNSSNFPWGKKSVYNLQINAESSVFIQFLQMALWSCINQLKAGSPEEEISLPWVHLAFQHFRVRLQNFSRIFTICPPILDSLTSAVTDLAGCEMVWPLWGLSVLTAWLARVGGYSQHSPGRESLQAMLQRGDCFKGHMCQHNSEMLRAQLTSASCIARQ